MISRRYSQLIQVLGFFLRWALPGPSGRSMAPSPMRDIRHSTCTAEATARPPLEATEHSQTDMPRGTDRSDRDTRAPASFTILLTRRPGRKQRPISSHSSARSRPCRAGTRRCTVQCVTGSMPNRVLRARRRSTTTAKSSGRARLPTTPRLPTCDEPPKRPSGPSFMNRTRLATRPYAR